jgi:hypothetical protein
MSVLLLPIDSKEIFIDNYIVNYNISKLINISIVYICEFCSIDIQINNLEYIQNNNNYEVNLQSKIDEIYILFGDKIKDIRVKNIDTKNFVNKNILNFDVINSNIDKLLDFCIINYKHLNSLSFDTKTQKLVSITACNKIFKYFDKMSINLKMYGNLILFIYDILCCFIMKQIKKHKLSEYTELIFGSNKVLPIILPNNIVQIQISKNKFKKLSEFGDFFVEIDSGNSEYTRISERVHKLVKLYDKVKDKDIKSNIKNIGGQDVFTDKIVIFNLKIYKKIYPIVAIVENDFIVNNGVKQTRIVDTDILIGRKSGINSFFENGLVIGKIDDDNKEKLCLEFVKKLDELLNKLFKDCFNNAFLISNEMIDDFFLTLMSYCSDYYNKLRISKFKSIDDLKSDYKSLMKSSNNDLELVSKKIRIKYKFNFPEKYINFYKGMSNTKVKKFIEKHFNILKDMNFMMKRMNKDNLDKYLSHNDIEPNNRTKYKTFYNLISNLIY